MGTRFSAVDHGRGTFVMRTVIVRQWTERVVRSQFDQRIDQGIGQRMKQWIAVLSLSLLAPAAFAIDTFPPMEDLALQARYENIVTEVRCLKCQNQSLKDSEAFLASDLRREIRRMLVEGKSDAEIYDFLVERYGEFALYRPRMSGKTLVLWAAPAVLLLGGVFVLVNVVRRRMAMPIDAGEAE